MKKLSKQQAAKEAQCYIEKPEHRMCSNCFHRESDKFTSDNWPWAFEKNIRCGIGGFAIKQTAVCGVHHFEREVKE